jgi:hypothetical protein
MARVFVSYAREDSGQVAALADDLQRAGHEVFFDQELVGGEVWWEQLIRQISQCDVFMPALSANYIASDPCKLELAYADELRRALCPVAVAPVSEATVSGRLASLQWVTYDKASKDSALALVHALATLDPPGPVPSPLPAPPTPPRARLASAYDLLGRDDPVPLDQQFSLLADLSDSLDGPEHDNAVVLLRRLKRRPEVLASVATEIDSTLRADQERLRSGPDPVGWTREHERVLGLVAGGVILLVALIGAYGTLFATRYSTTENLFGALNDAIERWFNDRRGGDAYYDHGLAFALTLLTAVAWLGAIAMAVAGIVLYAKAGGLTSQRRQRARRLLVASAIATLVLIVLFRVWADLY